VIAAGYQCSLICNSRGKIFSFGYNGDGRLGLGDKKNRFSPILMKSFEKTELKAISAGNDHSLFLTSQGQVFSCGTNAVGQLGLGYPSQYEITPILIAIDNIMAISSGGMHSLLLDCQGQVFSFGYNGSGRLGLGDSKDRAHPTLIKIPTKITAISAGNHHSLILDTQGQVFSFGDNENGRLGLGDERDRSLPTLIETPMGEIMAISAGSHHSLLLNSQGQVYSFGYSDNGLLGSGNIKHRMIPILIKDSRIGKMVAIAAGGGHSLLLNSKGQVYSFGNNDSGQLGVGDKKDKKEPTLIKETKNGGIVAISAGSSHSLFCDSQGLIYSAGSNSFGQLGLAHNREEYSPTLIRNIII
jgi:alpha-tubulin suppressor-like RCC1 family protein